MALYYYGGALDRNKLPGVKQNDGTLAKRIERAAERRREQERRDRARRKREQELLCQRVEHVGKMVGHGIKVAHEAAIKAHAELCRRMGK